MQPQDVTDEAFKIQEYLKGSGFGYQESRIPISS
jgi:hypothetical protein